MRITGKEFPTTMSTRSMKTSQTGGLARKLRFNSKMNKREIIEWLKEAKRGAYTVLTFDEVFFDAEITAEVLDLFRISSRHGRVWERLNLEFCEGQLDLVVTGTMMMESCSFLMRSRLQPVTVGPVSKYWRPARENWTHGSTSTVMETGQIPMNR